MATTINGTLVPATHHRTPILCDERAAGGLYKDMPLELLSRNTFSTFYTDFLDGKTEWVSTPATSGSGDILQDEACGLLRLTATAANQGIVSCQYTGADLASEGVVAVEAGRSIVFEARAYISDPANCDWFIGMGQTSTTFMSVAGAITSTGGDNFAGFHHLEAGSGVPIAKYAGTAIANAVSPTMSWTSALTADVNYLFGIRIEGTDRIRFYINRQPVTNWITMAVPFSDYMTPTFCMVANGAAINMDIDSVLVVQSR